MTWKALGPARAVLGLFAFFWRTRGLYRFDLIP